MNGNATPFTQICTGDRDRRGFDGFRICGVLARSITDLLIGLELQCAAVERWMTTYPESWR